MGANYGALKGVLRDKRVKGSKGKEQQSSLVRITLPQNKIIKSEQNIYRIVYCRNSKMV